MFVLILIVTAANLPATTLQAVPLPAPFETRADCEMAGNEWRGKSFTRTYKCIKVPAE